MKLEDVLLTGQEALQINPDACFCSLADANNLCKAQALKLLAVLNKELLIVHDRRSDKKIRELEKLLKGE